MNDRYISITPKRFGELEGGDLFQYDEMLFCKLSAPVADAGKTVARHRYNAVLLRDGNVCYVKKDTVVEHLEGRVCELG